jgi:hypothetical protein
MKKIYVKEQVINIKGVEYKLPALTGEIDYDDSSYWDLEIEMSIRLLKSFLKKCDDIFEREIEVLKIQNEREKEFTKKRLEDLIEIAKKRGIEIE